MLVVGVELREYPDDSVPGYGVLDKATRFLPTHQQLRRDVGE
jgi:hypothetical protein